MRLGSLRAEAATTAGAEAELGVARPGNPSPTPGQFQGEPVVKNPGGGAYDTPLQVRLMEDTIPVFLACARFIPNASECISRVWDQASIRITRP